ncbi:oxidoreductase [Lithospermum erythrorhizon]|uniref:Oxidoreductase n=1 Tax=Lithospermum erythrorhizon TaxID=34254 RepID=A0AAV3Q4A4_LITER
MVPAPRIDVFLGYDRERELKSFDETKKGVKGLVDAGVTKIPRIFVRNPSIKMMDGRFDNAKDLKFGIPLIDFNANNENPTLRSDVVKEVGEACKIGVFQVINHGIPLSVIDKMLESVKAFHEQGTETKLQYYTRDSKKSFVYNSNSSLYHLPRTDWRDTFTSVMAPFPPEPEDLPPICREIMLEYSEHMKKLGATLFEVVSEALGLEKNCLSDMECGQGQVLLGHYYPPCPEPDLTLGALKHTDIGFLTLLLQDHIGGLQILHENEWFDVPSTHPGAFVVFVGDLLQLITNDKFKSIYHRVISKREGPRISVASFLRPQVTEAYTSRLYRPIKEFVSKENPPLYKETTFKGYTDLYLQKWQDETPILPYLKLSQESDKDY